MIEIKIKPGFKLVHTKYRGDFEIPEKWDLVKLGDVTKFEYGAGLIEENRTNNGFPVYGSGGLVGYHSEFLEEGPGIIIARKGSLGNVFYTNENFWAIDTVYYITKKETEINLKFLFYLLKFLKLENYAIITAQPGISRDEVYTIFIKLPSSPEQKKIGSILTTIDDLINQTDIIVRKTENLKKSLMSQLMTKGIGHTGSKKIKWWFGKTIEIPDEWDYVELGKFVRIISGDYFEYSEFVDDGIPVLKIDNVMYGKIDWTNRTYLPPDFLHDGKSVLLKNGDIVLALNRPITHNAVKVAKLSNDDVPSILYQRVGKFEFKEDCEIDKDFFYCFLNSSFFKLLVSRIQIGSDQPYIKTPELLEQKFPLPKKIAEQKQIADKILNIDRKISVYKEAKSKLESLKKGLMQKLLTGQIRVKI